MSTFKQIKPVALLSALVCAGGLFFAVSASAMDKDSMSHDQTNGMQDNKAAEGMTNKDTMSHDGMKKDDMSHDSMKKDGMSHDGMKKKDSMSGDDGMAHDDDMKKDKM